MHRRPRLFEAGPRDESDSRIQPICKQLLHAVPHKSAYATLQWLVIETNCSKQPSQSRFDAAQRPVTSSTIDEMPESCTEMKGGICGIECECLPQPTNRKLRRRDTSFRTRQDGIPDDSWPTDCLPYKGIYCMPYHTD